MMYEPIKGSQSSLKQVIDMLDNDKLEIWPQNDVSGFRKCMGILKYFMPRDPSYFRILGASSELHNKLEYQRRGASRHINIRRILKNVLEDPPDLELLMDCNNTFKDTREMREIGSAIYSKTDVPFRETEEYRSLADMARQLLEESEGVFDYWERVGEIRYCDIRRASPAGVARAVSDIQKKRAEGRALPAYLRQPDVPKLVKQGLEALIYLQEDNPEWKSIPKLIVGFADYSLGVLDRKHRKLRAQAREVREKYLPAEPV